jgi:hypothetical protein
MRTLSAAMILVAVSPSFGAGLSQAGALYQLSSDYATCAAYYTVGETCLRNQSIRADYLEAQHKATILGYEAGAAAGVSVEGLYFESETAMESMKAMMKSDCDNIAVVVERYAESCQALMTDPQKRLRELSAKRTMTRRE